jgi:hypothetical protein
MVPIIWDGCEQNRENRERVYFSDLAEDSPRRIGKHWNPRLSGIFSKYENQALDSTACRNAIARPINYIVQLITAKLMLDLDHALTQKMSRNDSRHEQYL